MRTIVYLVFFAGLLFSCKKEDTIQPTPTNKAPVANAGYDATIHIPETDYVLDGKESYDPDKDYLEYSWQQISGPALYFFDQHKNQTTASLSVSRDGVYGFELKVTDKSGLSDRDTVLLVVVDNFAEGKTPVIRLFCNSLMMPLPVNQMEIMANVFVENDQGKRFDIRDSISARQILGPSPALIQEAYLDHEHIAIPINNLIKGTYQFQVEVTRKGIIAYDTATIQVVDDTLQGKEFIFETKWTVDGFNTVSAKIPERQDIFYMLRHRNSEVLVLFEDDPNWYEAFEGWDWESWLFYSTNACNSTIDIIINDDLASSVIGQKVKIKLRYL